MQELQLDSRNMDVVYVDHEQNIDFHFCREIAMRVSRLLVITGRSQCWQELSEQLAEETGMYLETQQELDPLCKNKLIVDFYGTNLSRFPKLAEENSIIAWGLNAKQKAYLHDRTRKKHIVEGFTQSIQGETVGSRMAAIYMQSQHWKLRELADTQESSWRWQELKKIKDKYDWKLEEIQLV